MEERFMRMALELAEKGRYHVSPNPMVGAVLVKGGRIVGKGYHRRFGGPHAEVAAIRNAGTKARGSVMYVTLEPCCFCGKTGACTDAIIQAGIRKVVAATLDPYAKVHGRGMRCLRKAWVETSVGLLASEARQLNEAYFIFHQQGRPFVVLKLAATLDGMLATTDGESQWITGPAARQRARELRCRADAVLVGVNTVLADDPRLTCRAQGKRRVLRVVLDTQLRTPVRGRLFRNRAPVLVLTNSTDRRRTERLVKAGAEVVRIPRGRSGVLSWRHVMAELHRRQVLTLLIEGGAEVASSALDAGVVDKLYVMHAPKVLGPGKVLSAMMKPRRLSRALRLVRVRHDILGDDVTTEGYVRRN